MRNVSGTSIDNLIHKLLQKKNYQAGETKNDVIYQNNGYTRYYRFEEYYTDGNYERIMRGFVKQERTNHDPKATYIYVTPELIERLRWN